MRLRQKFMAVMLVLALAISAMPEIGLAAKSESITQAQFLGLLVSAYEFFAGQEVDEAAITSKLSIDKPIRKALELDLLSDYEVAWTHLNTTRQTAVARILALKNALRTRLYGQATTQATVSQARDELGLALKLMGRSDTVNYATALSGDMDGDAPLTRANYSELLVRVYEALYGDISVKPELTSIEDTQSEYVQKAISLGVMSKYAVSNTFEPDAPVQLRQLASPILKLIEYDENAISELDREQARTVVSQVLLSFVGVEKAEGETKSKLLSVSWDWYVNQLITGKYSRNNCMPACGEMVLNFINRENLLTTEKLRALSPHDGQGWYDVEFYDVLTDAGAHLESEYDMTAKNMIRDLDAGRLLVVMCNFDGAASGHAMVVLGYEQTPAGTWFICNDPISSTPTNKYGKPGGYMRHIESEELLAAMRRHVQRYFRVMN